MFIMKYAEAVYFAVYNPSYCVSMVSMTLSSFDQSNPSMYIRDILRYWPMSSE